jgi:hypothetical protein
MLKRDFLDMDQLLEKWESLGHKKLPKSEVPKPVKARASGPGKGLTTQQGIAVPNANSRTNSREGTTRKLRF